MPEIATDNIAIVVLAVGVAALWKELVKSRAAERKALREGIDMEKSRTEGVEVVTDALVSINKQLSDIRKALRAIHATNEKSGG